MKEYLSKVKQVREREREREQVYFGKESSEMSKRRKMSFAVYHPLELARLTFPTAIGNKNRTHVLLLLLDPLVSLTLKRANSQATSSGVRCDVLAFGVGGDMGRSESEVVVNGRGGGVGRLGGWWVGALRCTQFHIDPRVHQDGQWCNNPRIEPRRPWL
jgi:hypothetical protein